MNNKILNTVVATALLSSLITAITANNAIAD